MCVREREREREREHSCVCASANVCVFVCDNTSVCVKTFLFVKRPVPYIQSLAKTDRQTHRHCSSHAQAESHCTEMKN